MRVISVGLDYGQDPDAAWQTLEDGTRAYVARYALGRDYHKLMRNRLQTLADRIAGGDRAIRSIACSSIRPRCWNAHWPATPDSAGSGSTLA
jgi:epoxyqueuosine reductase QueG